MAEKKRPRRGHGEGSVFQRSDGRWVAEVFLGVVNGKKRTVTRYGHTKTDALKKLKELQAQISQGISVEPTRLTVGDYLWRWLDHVRPSVKQRTYEGYSVIIRTHITPRLGNVALAKLAPLQIQQFYTERLDAGLSQTTVHHIHACLRTALNQAVKWQLIPRNPAIATEPPRVQTADPQFLDFDQAQRLIASLDGDEYAPPILLSLATGLRLGEIMGLRWTDIDWKDRAIIIQQTARYAQGGPVFEPRPKSQKMRRVGLPAKLVPVLQEHQKRQKEMRLASGPKWNECGLVFARPDGWPIRHDTTLTHLRKALKKAGLPPIRFHDLRHSAASLLIALGTPLKEVSELLGHSTITITANLYGHMLPGAEQRAADRMDAALFGNSLNISKTAR